MKKYYLYNRSKFYHNHFMHRCDETTTADLVILPLDKKVKVPVGTILLNAIRDAGIEIPAPCNGHHLCGKCKVKIDPAPPLKTPDEHLTSEEISQGIRSACRVVIRNDIRVTLPVDYSTDTRILEGDRIESTRIAPAVAIERVNGRFRLLHKNRSPVILNKWHRESTAKGIVMDLGTTTLVVSLLDLESGKELATASSVNPQVCYGHDVMTRICKASDPEGLNKLSSLVSDGTNHLIQKVCRKAGATPSEIVDGVIGGNTTMLQIAAGIDPGPLGKTPFSVDMEGGKTYSSSRFGLKTNPHARIYVPPISHAFVGSDISAGMLSINIFSRRSPLLFIDMGTNGEMALIADGRLLVTSTAAGPAFEGMGITCGMNAAPGAIEIIRVHDRMLNIKTVDDAPAVGICGSGIMDAISSLIRLDAVDSGGRLKKKANHESSSFLSENVFMTVNGVDAVELADSVHFTQKDIRQFQLAKSAVQTGAELLLDTAGVNPEQLDRIVIAGAFGYHLRKNTLRRIGILPRGYEGQIDFAGNTCRTGCAMLLLNVNNRAALQENMKQVCHVSIAESPDFQSRFVQNLSLF